MIGVVVLIAPLALIGLGVALWIRNNAVHAFRRRIISEIYRLYKLEGDAVYRARIGGASDSSTPYPDDWRWEEYCSISYNEMVWRFWRPLTSFYREGFPDVDKT